MAVANVVSRRYRYGASYVDPLTGVRFEGHHPLERPDLWKLYLDEGEGQYRHRGFEGTLRRKELEQGRDVSLFILGFNPDGEAVCGVRFHGPLESTYKVALMEEMADSPEIGDLEQLISDHIRGGVLEVKGAWSKGEAATGHRQVAAISRSVTHAMNWLGAEFAIAAVSDSLVPIGSQAGGRQFGEQWVPFPDERYRTVAVCWYRWNSHDLSTPDHQRAMRIEAEQLTRGPASTGPSELDVASTRTRSWQPLVLDVTSRPHREMLQVLRGNDAIEFVDRLEAQEGQLRDMVPAPTESIVREDARWVYYPWRRAAVRLLGPRSFASLRLDRNRNKLTREEQSRLRTLRVGIVGVSTGSAIAHILAMEGLAGELRLADFDTIDVSNLNRVAASVLDLGVNKAVVAARRVTESDPYLRVVAFTEGVRPDNLNEFLDGLDVVIEECDSIDMKFLIREAARERRIPVIMETSDRGILDVERFDLEPLRPIFHGLFGELDSTKLAGLTMAQKGPYVARLIGPSEASSRGAASFLEVGHSITGWPQLASEVSLGAAAVATAVRRLGTTGDLPSGRVRIDVDEIISTLTEIEIDTQTPVDLASAPPDDGPLDESEVMTFLVDAARRAPSGGNMQPWRFEADDDEVRFYLVPERSSIWDVQYRGSYLALGAALFNARVAAASIKQLGQVRLFPDGRPTNHVATLYRGRSLDADVARLLPYVATRSTNRRPGQPVPIDDTSIELLIRAVDREGAKLIVVSDRAKLEVGADLIAEADRLRYLIPEVHAAMYDELRWPGRDPLDEGLDVRTLELDGGGFAAIDLLVRKDVMGHLAEWRGGEALGVPSKFAVQSSSALAAITVPRAEPAWYVRAGAAFERFWLNAERLGIAVQPMVPLTLYATSEADLLGFGGERHLDELARQSDGFRDYWELADGETAVMVVRLFHAPAPSVHSSRLSLAEVYSRESKSTELPHEPAPFKD
ncbi:MAG: Rv1355c family protein [Acidimicrobiales bacterium]